MIVPWIRLEKNVYNPGETARGTLLIKVDKNLEIRKLTFSAYGVESYEVIYDPNTYPSKESKGIKRDIFFNEDLSPFLKSITTYSQDENAIVIPEGDFEIPFHFSLPQDSLGSYHGEYISIHYEVRVSANIGRWKESPQCVESFEVVNPTTAYTFSGDRLLGKEKKRKDGEPFLDLQLDMTNGINGIPSFSPGGIIIGRLKLENVDATKVKKAVIQLSGVEKIKKEKWFIGRKISADRHEIEYESKNEDTIAFEIQIPPNAKRSYNARNSEHYWLLETMVDLAGAPDVHANKIIQIAIPSEMATASPIFSSLRTNTPQSPETEKPTIKNEELTSQTPKITSFNASQVGEKSKKQQRSPIGCTSTTRADVSQPIKDSTYTQVGEKYKEYYSPPVEKRPQQKNLKLLIPVIIVAAVGSIIGFVFFSTTTTPAHEDFESIYQDYTFSSTTGYLTLSGKVINKRSDPSGPVMIGIKITDHGVGGDRLLYAGTTSPQPKVLQPQQEANFSAKIDLREYAYLYNGTTSQQPKVSQLQQELNLSELNESILNESEPFSPELELTVVTPGGSQKIT